MRRDLGWIGHRIEPFEFLLDVAVGSGRFSPRAAQADPTERDGFIRGRQDVSEALRHGDRSLRRFGPKVELLFVQGALRVRSAEHALHGHEGGRLPAAVQSDERGERVSKLMVVGVAP